MKEYLSSGFVEMAIRVNLLIKEIDHIVWQAIGFQATPDAISEVSSTP